MKRLTMLFAAAMPLVAAAQHDDRDWNVQDQESLNRTFKVAAGDNVAKLIVDNINGFIHVTGSTGSGIQVKVDQRIRAESKSDLDRAKREVKLDMTQDGNSVKLYADGPFRDRDGGTHFDSDREHYRVTFDIEVQVPSGAQLDLKTLNSPIEVKKSSGTYSVHTLNGHIDMEEIGGSGTAKTLNGPVKVAFTRNPSKESAFDTLNGSIDVYFQPSLDADITFRTLHGGVYSDFDVVTQPVTIKGVSSGNRFLYRSDGNMKVRAGKGGTELAFHTLNGSIRLHSK